MKIQIVYKKFRTHITKYKTLTSNNHYFNGTVVFILKEKLLNKEEIPLLSAKDVKELVIFQLYKQMTDEQMYQKIIHRHIRRQRDINNAYLRQNPNLLK